MKNVNEVLPSLVEFLEANSRKKVATILEEFKLLEVNLPKSTNPNRQTTSFYVDDVLIAVYCYYHKQWELVADVEYGKKASSSTGLNTMCKVGVKKWTAQQKAIKLVNEKILEMLTNNELALKDLAVTKDAMVEECRVVDVEDMPVGFETTSELV